MPEEFHTALEFLEKREKEKIPSWIRPLRRSALARFDAIGFPTPREEDWKYTNVGPFVKDPFQFSFESYQDALNPKKVEALLAVKAEGPVLVFVNGVYSTKASQVSQLPAGVRVESLAEALREDPTLVQKHLAQIAPFEKNGFTALNTAFFRDGAFLHLAEGKAVESPIHLLFISLPANEHLISQPRNLMVLEKGSRATVVENYVSLSEHSYFTNAVTEVVLKEKARLDHLKLQREDREKGRHVATTQAHLERESRFSSFSLSLGGRFARENLNVLLDAEGAECALDGLYLLSEGRHVDHHTRIDHLKPRGTSRQLYKGILNGKSTAVFNGKIFVHAGAEKTDAEQTNKNLLLSDEATVDTKPQLEIFTDDVKCTHGAAVGQLDEEQIFYLKSRGLDERSARSLLTYAFVSEVVKRIENESLRSGLDRLVSEELK